MRSFIILKKILMIKNYTYCVFFTLLFLTGCYKKEPLPGYVDQTLTPSLSLPLGDFEHNLNSYFNKLYSLTSPTPDSLILNGKILPNPEMAIEDSYKIDFRISQITTKFDAITGVAFKLIILNEYPTDMEVDISFIKLEGERTSSIPEEPIFIKGAKYDPNTLSFEANKQIEWVPLSDEIMKILEDIRAIEINYLVYTQIEGIDKVEFDKSAKISLHMGVQVDLEFNL